MIHPFLRTTIQSKFRTPNQTGDVGIEMEIEGQNLPDAPTGWQIKEEPSLRGEAREYVTRNAVDIDSLPKIMKRLCTALTQEGRTVNLTPRASTHIHLNMQQESFRTFFGLLCLVSMAEPVMLRLCGALRNGNLFCIPQHETHDLPMRVSRWADLISHYPEGFSRHDWTQRGKYAALNTDPIVTFGSVEFRCFPNTVTPDDVLRWAGWVVELRRMARDYPAEDYRDLFDRVYKTPETITRIFRDHPDFINACQTHPDDLIRVGVENAYEVYRGCLKIFDYTKPEKQKKAQPEEITVEEGQVIMFEDIDADPTPAALEAVQRAEAIRAGGGIAAAGPARFRPQRVPRWALTPNGE